MKTTLILALLLSACAPHASEHEHHNQDHSEGIEITENAPTLELKVHTDPHAGYNVELITQTFTFAPERASQGHVEGQGHAHLYINGVKINRVYSNWYHISYLEPGTHTISVDLNSNDHKQLLVDGASVKQSVRVTVE